MKDNSKEHQPIMVGNQMGSSNLTTTPFVGFYIRNSDSFADRDPVS